MLFKGKDKYDLEQQQWTWQTSASPAVLIVKIQADEEIPLKFTAPRFGSKIEAAQDRLIRRIEYYER
jgi:hypothetical protein